ncbi:hypothetical protein RvY_11236 [Ramazzottius varieornatus]|uniref:Cystatin domain-containing protein n=1 Tax=Ramazzottius varieornatus TaxID=947166 RepID=A0A1D1VKW2_RAMVA|nr:hypothetical protein RvY_11236 [Ramazzottius varieornatus]
MQNSSRIMLALGLVLLTVTLAMAAESKKNIAGGFTGEKPADAETQALADSVRNQVVQQLGARDSVRQFKVISVKTQVVAGTNYVMKIRISPKEYIHVKVFKPLPYTKQKPQVTAVEANKGRNDPL